MRPENSYSRGQVAKLLHVTQPHVQMRLDGNGLTPIRQDGRVWYDKAQVDAFARTFKRKRAPNKEKGPGRLERRERGRLCAQVFELRNQGKDFRSIVIETKGDPDYVQRFCRLWELGYEGREAEKKREEAAARERLRLKQMDRQRAREDHFARKALEQMRAGAPARRPPGFKPFAPPPLAPPSSPLDANASPTEDGA